MAGVALGKDIAKVLKKIFYESETPASIVSDYTIFADRGASVLRETYGLPAVLSEASFFTNNQEEQLLKERVHNEKEAIAYLNAIEAFFENQAKKEIMI